MAGKDIIMATLRELKRMHIVEKVIEGTVKQVEAAELLSLSDRQIRRILKRIREEGAAGVVHRLRGQPSNRQIPRAQDERIYADASPITVKFPQIPVRHAVGQCQSLGRGSRQTCLDHRRYIPIPLHSKLDAFRTIEGCASTGGLCVDQTVIEREHSFLYPSSVRFRLGSTPGPSQSPPQDRPRPVLGHVMVLSGIHLPQHVALRFGRAVHSLSRSSPRFWRARYTSYP